MLKKLKKIYAVFFILLALVIVGWFILFEYSVRWLEKKIEITEADLKQKGYTVSYSKVEITGSPFSIKAILHNPHLKDPKGLFEWQGQQVAIMVSPWKFYTQTWIFPEQQKISLFQNSPMATGDLLVKGATGKTKLSSQGKIDALSFSLQKLSPATGKKAQSISFEGASVKLKNLEDPLNLKISLETTVRDFEIALGMPPLNQPLIVTLKANLSGYQTGKPFPQSLSEWRDGGGVLDVSTLNLVWPPLSLQAEGTLTLDKKMYPLGSFSSQIKGYEEALEYLVQAGYVKQKNAAGVLFMFNLFSAPQKEQEKKLTVPITLQNKRLSIGAASLLKLKPVEGF